MRQKGCQKKIAPRRFEEFDNRSESSDDNAKYPPAPLELQGMSRPSVGVTGDERNLRHRLRCNREQTEEDCACESAPGTVLGPWRF